ncbi:MAG: hypothetical protein HOW73_02785 [Polyangiaceae bacterium]|nr:hypothetical protein [Polyangiaceae bacterium]
MPARSSLPYRSIVSALMVAVTVSSGCTEDDTQDDDAPPAAPPTAVTSAVETAPQQPVKKSWAPSRADCSTVPVFVAGASAGSVCAEDATREGLTVVDLADTWTPRIFSPSEDGSAPAYRKKYLELASQPNADLGLHGIQPTMSILATRLADDKRRKCEAALDLAPIGEDAKSKAATVAIQGELVCEGLMKKAAANGRMGQSTFGALEIFRRRHMIVGAGVDGDTLTAMSLGGDERAFRALLRGLRERVADATGIIEDGSASNQRATVQGRELDLTSFARSSVALENGAPDLLDAATDVAARELGWSNPDAAREFIAARGKDGFVSLRVALPLPAAPAYHNAAMDLRVEIDRGDVFYETPGAAAAKRKLHGEVRRPAFVVYAKDGAREIPLLSWTTTIGGWKKEQLEDGEIALKYKESDVGDRVWRRLIAAPAWMPPDSTPDNELVRVAEDGTMTLKSDIFQPGYRNAYGLVMLIHDEALAKDDEDPKWADHGIRTHGSVDYRSIKNGTSHGCHRLYNQLALRLSGFLLQHRNAVRRGNMRAGYHRTIEKDDQTVEIDIPSRGYLYELEPPVPVRVLEGNVVGESQSPRTTVIRLEPQEPKST